MIRDARPMEDAARVTQIYNREIATNTATFEVDELGEAVMANRIAAVQAGDLPFIVATEDGVVVGYAYASPFHERAAYVHTVTCSVYLDDASRGRGLGRSLYDELIHRLRTLTEGPHAPVHSVVALIALPNDASVALHESVGFSRAGVIAQAGRKFDSWIDVGYWQLSLEP